jgi:hypothetical protein
MDLLVLLFILGGGYVIGIILLLWATFDKKKTLPLLLSLAFILPQHGCTRMFASGGIFHNGTWASIYQVMGALLLAWILLLLLFMFANKFGPDSKNNKLEPGNGEVRKKAGKFD